MTYDVIIVGGGLAGSALAKQLAERGYRILVIERELQFKDRVRGEQMHPWGVTEARSLGIYEPLTQTCGYQTRWWVVYRGATLLQRRDLALTPHRVGSFHFYHPAMQETLLRLAEEAGAETRRGVLVEAVSPGNPATVQYRHNGQTETIQARLVVGADGRTSQVRQWGGFAVQHDPDLLVITGALLDGCAVPDDGVYVVQGRESMVLIAPQGKQRARAYFISRKEEGGRPLSGRSHVADFFSACRATGAPEEWFERATVTGPLAQFNGADHWVGHPARDGVVLVGDAAAASDPSFGCGLSLTLLDVHHLTDCLVATTDWQAATDQYASKHDNDYGAVHRVLQWSRELRWSIGPEADARRERVSARLQAEPERGTDIVGLGPMSRSDEATRRFLLDS